LKNIARPVEPAYKTAYGEFSLPNGVEDIYQKDMKRNTSS
jgi:hypothetical protein